jgi:hypothetical protein
LEHGKYNGGDTLQNTNRRNKMLTLATIIGLSAIIGITTTAAVEFCKKAAANGNKFFIKITGGWKTVVTALVIGTLLGAGFKGMLVLNLAPIFFSAETMAALVSFIAVPWLGFIAAGFWSGAIASGAVSLLTRILNPGK